MINCYSPRCVINTTADGNEVATNAMDSFLSSITGGMDCLPSYVEVNVCQTMKPSTNHLIAVTLYC